jgi:hypothetical protein
MTSLLFKCIPCARSGKAPISEACEESQPQRVYRKKSTEPVEGRLYHTGIQQTPIVRARGYEIVEMGTIDETGNGINTDIKTTK